MNRAALAEKRGAEFLEDLVDLYQDAPEAVGIVLIVTSILRARKEAMNSW